MVSSFYSSNQQKLKRYVADRRVEEHNGDIQQAKVYQAIAEQQGDIEQADRLAKLGMTILGKVAATEVPITNKQGGVAKMTVKEHILSMIEAGTLSNWWEAIKRIPPAKLSKKARIVQDDIKHNELLKQTLNELVSKVALAKPLFKQEGIVPTNIHTIATESANNLIDELLKLLTGDDMKVAEELDEAASVAGTTATAISGPTYETAGPAKTDIDKAEKMEKSINDRNWNSVLASLRHDKNSIFYKFPYLLKAALDTEPVGEVKTKLDEFYSKLPLDVKESLKTTAK